MWVGTGEKGGVGKAKVTGKGEIMLQVKNPSHVFGGGTGKSDKTIFPFSYTTKGTEFPRAKTFHLPFPPPFSHSVTGPAVHQEISRTA